MPYTPINTSYDSTNSPLPPQLSPEKHRALADKLSVNFRPGPLSHVVILCAAKYEKNLPAVKGSVVLSAIDGEPTDIKQELTNTTMLLDTGAQVTVISADLLSPVFQECLTSKVYERYTSGSAVQVSFRFCLSIVAVALDTVALVLPTNAMPNKLKGIILGQHGVIDCLDLRLLPRKFAQHLPANFWGEVHLNRL